MSNLIYLKDKVKNMPMVGERYKCLTFIRTVYKIENNLVHYILNEGPEGDSMSLEAFILATELGAHTKVKYE